MHQSVSSRIGSHWSETLMPTQCTISFSL